MKVLSGRTTSTTEQEAQHIQPIFFYFLQLRAKEKRQTVKTAPRVDLNNGCCYTMFGKKITSTKF
jgi:hypothetical protein